MKLVADANVLLAAVLGGRAKLILAHPEIETVFATTRVLDEVEEYAVLLARKRRLALDTVLLAVAALPVVVIGRQNYAAKLTRAQRLIGRSDPDDVDTLALAFHLKLPISSNDNDFEDAGVEWHTTAELLSMLRISEHH